ncbi:IS3 family transposase [Saccharicrinis sp. FJH62]|uniref:IS3 family transposase n=1 Tax=Saccharicrinis sp. FJH62 TaxID=3344657 RepID=UPI0035D3E9C1
MVGINRQRYYRSYWISSVKQDTATLVVSMVNEIRMQMPRIGTRKLYYLLENQLNDLHVGRDKLFAILEANNMLIAPKRSYHVTTNSHHRFHKHKNLIEEIDINRPEQVWVSDITYIGGRGNNYLALVTDAYSKKIMGYDLSDSLAAEGSVRALKMAAKNRQYKDKPLIHHSDRGLQYCCNEYQKVLRDRELIPSMTESYDPYANAVAERINGILKHEFLLEQYKIDTNTMKLMVAEAVKKYNKIRPHYSCYMRTPEQMHKQNKIKIRTYKKKLSCKKYSQLN